MSKNVVRKNKSLKPCQHLYLLALTIKRSRVVRKIELFKHIIYAITRELHVCVHVHIYMYTNYNKLLPYYRNRLRPVKTGVKPVVRRLKLTYYKPTTLLRFF